MSRRGAVSAPAPRTCGLRTLCVSAAHAPRPTSEALAPTSRAHGGCLQLRGAALNTR